MNKIEIQNLIKDLIEKLGIKINEISISPDENNLFFSVQVDNPHFFINHDGEALNAFNHIIRRLLETKDPTFLSFHNGEKNNKSILVDINDFQKKKIDGIKAIAHMMSERARYFKSNIEFEPMSSFERRIVHEFLAEALDLKTESIGVGPTRRVVIKYTGNL